MDFAAVAGVDSTDDSKAEADDEDDNDDLVVQHATPVGSKFGEEGERLRSAARRRGRPGSATGTAELQSSHDFLISFFNQRNILTFRLDDERRRLHCSRFR